MIIGIIAVQLLIQHQVITFNLRSLKDNVFLCFYYYQQAPKPEIYLSCYQLILSNSCSSVVQKIKWC